MTQEQENTINRELFNILDGTGWCTDGYIINCMPELTNEESFELMKKLAKKGLLFDEDALEEHKDDSMPDKGKVSLEWVEETWRSFLVPLNPTIDNSWLTEDYLKSLGYYKISDNGQYGVYQNEHFKVSSPTYGPLPKDYRKISFNRDTTHGILFGVRSDWDTRYSIANVVAKNQ
jgi:hypothetical protein